MTKAFKIGIGNLLLEFLAHALVFLCTLNSARAVAACPLQALFNCLYCFFVGIKCYFHLLTPQFLRRPPLISSLDYTIYRNPKIVKHASASLSVREDSFCNAKHIMPERNIVTVCTIQCSGEPCSPFVLAVKPKQAKPIFG